MNAMESRMKKIVLLLVIFFVTPAWAYPLQPPKTEESKLLMEVISSTVNGWMRAWTRGDANEYLDFYLPENSPVSGISYSAWRKQRIARLSKADDLVLDVNIIGADLKNNGIIEVRLIQFYTSKTYQDAVIKQLHFARFEGRLKISKEFTERKLRKSEIKKLMEHKVKN